MEVWVATAAVPLCGAHSHLLQPIQLALRLCDCLCSRSGFLALHEECLQDQTALAIRLDEAHELLLAPLPSLKSETPEGRLRAWPALPCLQAGNMGLA